MSPSPSPCLRPRPGRPVRLALIATALAALAGGLAAGAARADELAGVKDARVRKGAEVVLEVRAKMKAMHVDGARFTDADYYASAVRTLARTLEAPDSRIALSSGDRDALLAFARARPPEDGSFGPLFAEMDRRLAGRRMDDVWVVSDALARGVIETVGDPFTHYFDQKAMWRIASQLFGGKPKSFGFKAVREEGAYRVGFVYHGYDAAAKGVAQGDIIVEVDGVPTAALSEAEVLAATSGQRESEVRLRLYRPGWARAHEVTLAATAPAGPNVESALLPGGIGYVRLDTFLFQAGGQVGRAVERLEAQGMKALVFDVRDNPGGAVISCIEICDLFLGEGELITRTESRGGLLGDQTYRAKEAGTRPRYPMAILVNGSSASASEMFAGALKDNGRALLVGQTTYGKGVGQGPVLLDSAFGERFLLLTQMTYYTPRGTTPQRVGIEPDVAVSGPTADPKDAEAIFALRAGGVFRRYVDGRLAADRATLFVLANDDGGDCARWPGFDALHASVETAAAGAGLAVAPSREAVRRELRRELRRAIAESDRRVAVPPDLRDDPQLRRAHEVALERLRAPRERAARLF